MAVQIVEPDYSLAPAILKHISEVFNAWVLFQFGQKTVKILFLKDDFRIIGFRQILLYGTVFSMFSRVKYSQIY